MDYFVKIDEFNVRYLKLGNGNNLVFLHGIWNYSKTYMKLLKELSKKYAVYALDLPGFGKTNRPNIVWTYEDYAKFLYKFVKELKEAFSKVRLRPVFHEAWNHAIRYWSGSS